MTATENCFNCHACDGEHLMYMVLCPSCGNKRCPKATDHRLACSGSNDPGQLGSVYGKVLPATEARMAGREWTRMGWMGEKSALRTFEVRMVDYGSLVSHVDYEGAALAIFKRRFIDTSPSRGLHATPIERVVAVEKRGDEAPPVRFHIRHADGIAHITREP